MVPRWQVEEDSDFFSALSIGPERKERQQPIFPLSSHHPHPTSDDMGLRDFLRIPKKIRGRVRSKARSEISPIEGPSNDDPAVPRPSESTPDLGTGPSTLPTPSFLTSSQESKGMQMGFSNIQSLTTVFFYTMQSSRIRINTNPFLVKSKAGT